MFRDVCIVCDMVDRLHGFRHAQESRTSKKMEILKRNWSNFEIDLRPLKCSPKNLRGLKSISKFDQISFKISIFWKIQIQTFEGLIYCSKAPALYNYTNMNR